MTDHPPSILNQHQPVIARSSDEAHTLINMPWRPSAPVYDHDQIEPKKLCRLSEDDFVRLFDVVMANILILVVIIVALLIFGCYCVYVEIYDCVDKLLTFHLRKVVANVTKSG